MIRVTLTDNTKGGAPLGVATLDTDPTLAAELTVAAIRALPDALQVNAVGPVPEAHAFWRLLHLAGIPGAKEQAARASQATKVEAPQPSVVERMKAEGVLREVAATPASPLSLVERIAKEEIEKAVAEGRPLEPVPFSDQEAKAEEEE